MSNIEKSKVQKKWCSVVGCGNSSDNGKGLLGLPKSVERATEWLQAAGLGHLVDQLPSMKSIKFCRKHFLPTSFMNKHIASDAVPRLYLPEPDKTHHGVLCSNCETLVSEVRYKCTECDDYDLCKSCENRNVHTEHNMLKLTTPVSNVYAKEMVKKLKTDSLRSQKKDITADHLSLLAPMVISIDSDTQEASSDDEPITKYISRKQDCELSDEVKTKICNEINRVLKSVNKTHKPIPLSQKPVTQKTFNISTQTMEDDVFPEVEFADVNDSDFQPDIKSEDVLDMAPESVTEPEPAYSGKLYNLLTS